MQRGLEYKTPINGERIPELKSKEGLREGLEEKGKRRESDMNILQSKKKLNYRSSSKLSGKTRKSEKDMIQC